ncbi:DedA family protein [Brevibacterium sp. UMB10442]|nr:DedA family protein [Brevibacterium sp. UMB10442]
MSRPESRVLNLSDGAVSGMEEAREPAEAFAFEFDQAGAVAGDQVGFWLGHKFGRRLFKDDARILRTDRLATAEAFFNRRGPLALVIGRFVPIVRTYVPVAAGTAQMPYRNFVIWNVGGALAWVGSMVLIGALLGHIPGITHSIDGIILLIIGISMLPVAISAITSYIKKRRTT